MIEQTFIKNPEETFCPTDVHELVGYELNVSYTTITEYLHELKTKGYLEYYWEGTHEQLGKQPKKLYKATDQLNGFFIELGKHLPSKTREQLKIVIDMQRTEP